MHARASKSPGHYLIIFINYLFKLVVNIVTCTVYKRLHLHTWWFHPLQLASVMYTHWHRYQAYARATCTVWCFFWVVVVDAYVYVVVVVVAMGC